MRIGGLASGINTDQIIKDLMNAEKQPLNKMEQEREWLTYKRDAYRDVNKKLSELDTMTFDMKLNRSYNSKEVRSSDSAVSATAVSNAEEGSYKMEVLELAEAAYNYSENGISNGEFDPDDTLKNQQGNLINGISLDDTFSITTYGEGGEETTVSFNVTGEKSLHDILDEISDSELGVRAFYDKGADKVMLERTETGDFNTDESNFLGAEIGFNGTSASFLADTLDIKNGKNNGTGWELNERGGTDARFTYNNSFEMTSHTNDYSLNGMNFTFNKVGTSTVSVSNNVDDSFEKVMNFVEKYNEIIDDLNGKTEEKRYRDFSPLTAEQKKEMEKEEIELWEEKSKSGMLKGDSVVSGVLSSMRQNWYAPVETDGEYSMASQIGITTTSNYREGGKLEVDEDQLRSALRDSPDSVAKLFSGTDTNPGIARRLETSIEEATKSIERKAGKPTSLDNNFMLGRQIKSINDDMSSFQDRLTAIENRYWREFGAMEKAIQKMNSQSAYLMQNFGGGM
ncbi:flagellar hook-associated protein 2 [Halobacillus karajensis]|uniref:Flagellar hook-associated protein 2 n=1 Tax=Halobacillus karajensis TaxID=195088 RepID=A0A059NYW6_9BACI|nr:flagellar hook-associated protein 2 [Halobacillus karajensis]CDQ19214.1 Flagellar cap protein [Halobacillus karajensis]CDQ22712.1 Flagellar cap protein [Halobacillus karajensis]CDQ26194.1 Flagellar cap protein [Halobacillus karajensis]